MDLSTNRESSLLLEPTSSIPSVSVEVGSPSGDSSLCEVGTAPADENVIPSPAIVGLHVPDIADIRLSPFLLHLHRREPS